MKLNALIFFSIILLLTSCTGRSTTNIGKFDQQFGIGDTVKELSNNIMVIYHDSKKNYWFGSWKDGLYKYDGNTIIHYTSKDGLLSDRVEEIKEDKYGNIFINTSKGLNQYNGKHFLALMETISTDIDWKLNADDLWFKNAGDVFRYDGNNLYRLKLPTIKLGEDYILQHPSILSPYAIYCVYKDNKANIWFGTAQLGVCRYNGESFDWITETDVTELHNGPSNGVRSIAEDKNGDFWFNTEYRYNIYTNNTYTKNDTVKKIFYNRIKSIGCLDGKKDGHLNEYLSIIKDDNNNLWMAIYLHGVWKYDGEKINHYPIQVNAKNIPIYCLYKDKNGDIWLGTHENGAFKFNGQTFEKFIL